MVMKQRRESEETKRKGWEKAACWDYQGAYCSSDRDRRGFKIIVDKPVKRFHEPPIVCVEKPCKRTCPNKVVLPESLYAW